MSAHGKPTTVSCKDGSTFLVTGSPGHVVLFATFRDKAVVSTGLGRFQTFHEPGDLRAEHKGMPVEVVRAYAKAHGGVDHAGEEALALLKSLPSTAEPVMGEPVTDSRPQAAVEVAPESPLTIARGAGLAGWSPAEAHPRALDQHDVEGAPALVLDELTTAVIEARRAVADFEGPVVWKREWAKPRVDRLPEISALWRRISKGAGLASRLIVVTQPRYASHPLQAEGVQLRAQLQRIGDEAFAMKRDRDEADIEHYQRLNSVLAES
ncbi:hypothetical protein MKK68_24550 [Methylobacterium sp. E-016]|uniref:hypothetical protein n=1 Tax=Methylobacterium sp. E-016 TaxID=2836556 RepID=UPI001FBB418D|nr:hypothetical protein [Methylobacterium sp. E-016]MCJ2078773.1 hypothetical protein [Methylobacterium sp. E-016]